MVPRAPYPSACQITPYSNLSLFLNCLFYLVMPWIVSQRLNVTKLLYPIGAEQIVVHTPNTTVKPKPVQQRYVLDQMHTVTSNVVQLSGATIAFF